MTTEHEEQIGKLRLELRDMEAKLRDEFITEIRTIRENHLTHIQSSMATLSSDVEWIKRFFWIVATTSVGGLVAGVTNLFFA